MASNDDFGATAVRMMLDASVLGQAGRHRTACYVAGYVVECTLKALLELDNQKHKSHDLETLQDLVGTLALTGTARSARYGNPGLFAPTMLQQVAPPTIKPGKTIFHCHWDPEHRYDGARWASAQVCDDYLREAGRCHDVLVQMTIDGVL